MKMLRPLLRFAASPKLTVVCLFLLFVLTFLGTLHQVENGLFQAQQKFFYSLFLSLHGWLWLPGARLVMWVLSVNLLAAAIVHFKLQRRTIGITVIHVGLLLFLVSGFLIFHCSEESQVSLAEGEGANVSLGYHTWELAVWENVGSKRDVIAFDINVHSKGSQLDFSPYGVTLDIIDYYPNSLLVEAANSGRGQALSQQPLSAKPEENSPGVKVSLLTSGKASKEINLHNKSLEPAAISVGDQVYYMALQRKRYVFPFILRLKDFRKEEHPMTSMARSFESDVEIISGEVKRQVTISMNKPMRVKDYTFFQASYAFDVYGREVSTFAVVKNAARFWPYIASMVVILGLAIHFVMMALIYSRKKGGAA